MFFYAPYGKGYGKYWLVAVIILIVLFTVVFYIGSLIERINNGEVTSPYLILLSEILYPMYSIIIDLTNFVLAWGVIAVAVISVAIMVPFWLFSLWQRVRK